MILFDEMRGNRSERLLRESKCIETNSKSGVGQTASRLEKSGYSQMCRFKDGLFLGEVKAQWIKHGHDDASLRSREYLAQQGFSYLRLVANCHDSKGFGEMKRAE